MAEKAEIIVEKKSGRETIPVMFNPNEYTIGRSSSVTTEKSGLKFGAIQTDDFTVSLFFDTYEKGEDVREKTDAIAELLEATENKNKGQSYPPLCIFSWGDFTYRGYVTKVSRKYTMFLSSGVPVRADVSVTFKYHSTDKQRKKEAGQSGSRKYRVVTEETRLDLLAEETLGDSGLWREIARANNITNPLDFPGDLVGTTLIIPDFYSLEERG